MKISLVGMSGIGKTYWSRKLQEKGFVVFCCDDVIEEKLQKEIQRFGLRGIEEVALWLGQPYEAQYAENSQKYLQYEQEALEEILGRVKAWDDQDIVIDTTGSVIEMPLSLLEKLSQITQVVHLGISEQAQEALYQLYLKEPKPVIWGDLFLPQEGESPRQTLARCYPQFLKYRAQKYAHLASLTLDYPTSKSPQFDILEWLNRHGGVR